MSTLNAVPFRSTILYNSLGAVPAGSVLTVGSNGTQSYTNNLGLNAVTFSTLTGSTIATTSAVGIATSSPLAVLDVNGSFRVLSQTYTALTSGTGIDIIYSGGGTLSSGTRGSGGVLAASTMSYAASSHTFYTGSSAGTNAMTVNSSGQVGVGIANPSYALQVTKSIYANNFQQFEWVNTQSSNGFGYSPSSSSFVIKIATLQPVGTNSNQGMINVRGQMGGWINTNTMYIDLQIITRGTFQVWGTVNGSYSSAVSQVDLIYIVNGSSQYDIYIFCKGANYIVYDLVVSGNTGSNVLYDPSTAVATSTVGTPAGATSLTSLAYIYQNATYVGIGITNPSYPLHVNGSINLTGSILYNGSAITTGTGSIWNTSSGGIAYYNGGNVGIGTATPFTNYTAIGGTNQGLDIWGPSTFDAEAILRVYNNSSQYGRAQIHIIGQYLNSNDAWSLTTGRMALIFGYTSSQGGAVNLTNSIQSFAGQIGLMCSGYSTTTPTLYITTNGTVFFPAYTTAGTMYCQSSGQLYSASDRRIKDNIVYYPKGNNLSGLLQLKPATYTFVDEKEAPRTTLGFIAQDVEVIFPDVVDGKKYEYQYQFEQTADGKDTKKPLIINGEVQYKLDEQGNKIIRPRGFDDRALLAHTVLAIQELNDQLTAQVSDLQSQLATVLSRLNAAGIN